MRNDYVIIALIILVALAAVFVPTFLKAQATDAASVSVVMCTKIATTGPLDYYYCEPEIGQPFYTNSVGFMLLEQ